MPTPVQFLGIRVIIAGTAAQLPGGGQVRGDAMRTAAGTARRDRLERRGQIQGQSDTTLNDRGRAQAAELARCPLAAGGGWSGICQAPREAGPGDRPDRGADCWALTPEPVEGLGGRSPLRPLGGTWPWTGDPEALAGGVPAL